MMVFTRILGPSKNNKGIHLIKKRKKEMNDSNIHSKSYRELGERDTI